MSETTKIQIDQYSMKMQLYPNAEQREIIDRMLRALHVAYNITFHEVFQKNDAVCTKPNKNEVKPDFKKMAKGKAKPAPTHYARSGPFVLLAYCSIWRPTIPAAVSATLTSVSPMRAPCSRESSSTAPMASPSAMMGETTCAV